MTDDNAPYVLWEETLPEGATAKVIICPSEEAIGVVLHWNNSLHHVVTADSQERAEQKGWDLRRQLLSGELGSP